MNFSIRGIRGATCVSANDAAEILEATTELLQEIKQKNSLARDDIAAVIFSMTEDLDAVFPAEAARRLGWSYVPLFCTREINVPGALPRCVRVLMLVNTAKTQREIRHIYLKEAAALRTDLQD